MTKNGKEKITRTEVKRFYGPIVQIGYCGACDLLRNHEPWAYNCGVYGWNYDVYDVYGIRIVTGYRNMTGKQPENLKKYEEMAENYEKYFLDKKITYEEMKNDTENALHKFCVENGGY